MSEDKDRLTGLVSDDYLRAGLEQEFQRSRRFGRDLSFVLLEPIIPEESRFDMLYAVLKFLAHVCEVQTRQIDTGVRWGQQILMVLPETSREGALRVKDKLATCFHDHVFTHPDHGTVIAVGLKQALQVFPEDGPDKETILFNLREAMDGLGKTAGATPAMTGPIPACPSP